MGILPFLLCLAYKLVAGVKRWTLPAELPATGKTFFSLMSSCTPCCVYLFCRGWAVADVHKITYAFVSFMPIWWVNCLGGVDMWIEEPLGLPARTIAFTPTWIVSHGVFFLQWALDPSDIINRLVFIGYMCPQLVYLNFYFRHACRQDWGTQFPIYCSYFMHLHLTLVELAQWVHDVQRVGMSEISKEVFKDCPLNFTQAQLAIVLLVCATVALSENPTVMWAMYSLCGPLNWLGII